MLNGGKIYYPYFPELASKIGTVGSLILQLIHWYSSRENSPLKDDFRWAYFSYQTIADKLGVSKSTVRRSIQTLKTTGLLVVDNYNKHRYDKTLWYRIDYTKLQELLEEDMKTFSKVSAQNEHMEVLKMSTGGAQNEHMEVFKMSTPCAQNGTTIQYKIKEEKEVENLAEEKQAETPSPHDSANQKKTIAEVLEKYTPRPLLSKIESQDISKQNTKDKVFTVFNLLYNEKYGTTIKISPTSKERGLVSNLLKSLTLNQVTVTQFFSYVFENWESIRRSVVWDGSNKPRLPEKPNITDICYTHKEILAGFLKDTQTQKKSVVSKEQLLKDYQRRKSIQKQEG